MTITRPHRYRMSLMHLFYGGTVMLFVVGAIFLIVLYNGTVNLRYELKEAELRREQAHGDIAELKEKFFLLFTSENLETLAASRNLIKERNPEYFQTSLQWQLASE